VAPVINTTMTTAAPFGVLANAGTTWCGGIAGFGIGNTPMSTSAHLVRLTDAVPTPQKGRDSYVATKQAGPPRGVPR
jgi:hypothetical protein